MARTPLKYKRLFLALLAIAAIVFLVAPIGIELVAIEREQACFEIARQDGSSGLDTFDRIFGPVSHSREGEEICGRYRIELFSEAEVCQDLGTGKQAVSMTMGDPVMGAPRDWSGLLLRSIGDSGIGCRVFDGSIVEGRSVNLPSILTLTANLAVLAFQGRRSFQRLSVLYSTT